MSLACLSEARSTMRRARRSASALSELAPSLG
jgi:cob(I)alamin adenosyltransferase